MNELFKQALSVVNVGSSLFAESLAQQNATVLHVDWTPPLVQAPTHTPSGIHIDAANDEAVGRMMKGEPHLVGMGLASEVIPGLQENTILHAGPPIAWERACGPLRGAIMGALVYEGLAETPQAAQAMVEAGEIQLAPCHDYQAVGPMAGVLSPSMPVWIVENRAFGSRAYANLNEGLGRVLRYGAYGDDVYARLHWMRDVLYPTLNAALEHLGALDLRGIIAQALHMGDECHNRNRAGTSLLLRVLVPALARSCHDKEKLAQVAEFIDGNDHFFLNLAMAAAKSMMIPTAGIEGSSLVCVMARNGTDFGIKLAGEPDTWFTAPAGKIEGLYLAGFSEADANPDIGDSTITETAGYGAFAMASAPAIASFVGGTARDALETTLEMYEICHAEHQHFTIPALNFRGTPTGIDVRRVMATGILPKLNTGIAHKEPGIGMVGAGVLRAPEAAFAQALDAIRAW